MKKTSLCCLLTSFAWNGFTYKFTSEEEKEAQSQLALSVLDKEAMSRMFNLNNKIDSIECRKDTYCYLLAPESWRGEISKYFLLKINIL